MKKTFNKVLNKLGYQIKKVENGFSFNSNLDWLKKNNIKTILDIGANEGQFAKYINNVLPDATIYSFEPIPACFKKLLFLSDGIKNLHPINIALGDKNDKIDFYQNEFSPSSSIMKMKDTHIANFPHTKETKLIKIEVRKLDDFIHEIEIANPVLVKIDVQGYEGKVLLGGNNFFKNIPKIVIIEASLKEMYENEISFNEIYEMFRSMNYKYHGNLYQLYSPLDGEILQADAVFIKQ